MGLMPFMLGWNEPYVSYSCVLRDRKTDGQSDFALLQNDKNLPIKSSESMKVNKIYGCDLSPENEITRIALRNEAKDTGDKDIKIQHYSYDFRFGFL